MKSIGIICPSEIAFRRFLPALAECGTFDFAGVAVADAEEWFGEKAASISPSVIDDTISAERGKAERFIEQYGGGRIFGSYAELVNSADVDAVYIPLPPALHFKWAKAALEVGKHVFVEKPATTSLADTNLLIESAKARSLALHENYMFAYHRQIEEIAEIVKSGELGDVRLYRITFGFPRRAMSDFRYNKALGGGAILDAGGYTMKYASLLLGPSARMVSARKNHLPGFEVDVFGSATLENNNGATAQVAFGMDNDYRCDLEIWGSKGTLTSNRILTAPAGFVPSCTIKTNQETRTLELSPDNTFLKSIQLFDSCISNPLERSREYEAVKRQAELVEQFQKLAS